MERTFDSSSDGSCWEIITIKQIHTFTPATYCLSNKLLKHVAGERVDLLDGSIVRSLRIQNIRQA